MSRALLRLSSRGGSAAFLPAPSIRGDETLQMGHEPMDVIVSTDWLAERLNDPELVIVDVRPEDFYATGHIPGARNIDIYPLKILDSDPDRIAAWVEMMESVLERAGISHDATVVFYEDISGTSAARAVWLMHALSITTNTAMLDGGLAAWVREGHSLSTEPANAQSSSISARLDPTYFATADDILAVINDEPGDTAIVDTRGDLEWMQGTIPSARHLEWIHHLNQDGSFRSVDELHTLYRELGIAPGGSAITFCASGYRAAHTWLVLRLLGYEDVRNYAPSWGEWGRREDLPIVSPR